MDLAKTAGEEEGEVGEGEVGYALTPRRHARPWMAGFLEALARTPNATAAAHAVGMSHAGVYKARERDPEFAEAWAEALSVGLSVMEHVLWRRATVGEPRTTTRQTVRRDREGNVLYEDTVTESGVHASDWLLWKFLAAHKPDVWGDNRQVRVGGEGGGPVQVEVYRWPTPERAAELLRLAIELEAEEVVDAEAAEENGG